MWRLTLALIVLLVCSGSADAATTVAKVGKLELAAKEKAGRLCMSLRRDGRYRGRQCGRIPRSPHRPLRMHPDVGWDTYVAAVPPSVLTAETEDRQGRRERVRTRTARGFVSRFILAPAPPPAMFVRFFGAGERLLAMDGGPAGYISLDENETVVSGRPGEGVIAHTEPRIAPTPEQPDRIRTLACLLVFNGLGGTGFCDEESANGIAVVGACGKADRAGAIVGPGVSGVRLTLGSGAELVLPAGELPAPFGGRRVIGATVPSGEAVRDAAALDGSGAVVARTDVALPPGGQPCPEEEGTARDAFSGALIPAAPPPGATPVASAGGRSLFAADQGETLCVGIDALAAGNCPPPPVDSDRPRLLRRGGTVAGALSADAARITLRLRGADITVTTRPGPGVTFFAAAVPAGRAVTGAVVRDAGGRIIGISERGIRRRSKPRVRTLAERGGLAVRLRGRCVAAPSGPRFCGAERGTPIDGPVLRHRAAIAVSCEPRGALAYGRAPDRLRPPRIVLAGGRTVRPRSISLPGQDAWVAFLPDAAVRRVGPVPLRLPPASAQCGYAAVRAF